MSTNLLDALKGQLSDGVIEQLSQQIGGADKTQTAVAAQGIVTTLLGALTKNAANEQNASALANALDSDHDGSILDDLSGVLAGMANGNKSGTTNGAGILGHLLGGKRGQVEGSISQVSGLDNSQVGSLMEMLAPIVMGTLGKQKKDMGLDVGGLIGMLMGERKQMQESSGNSQLSPFLRLLDQDGDGDITDDAINIGTKLLGSLFGKK